MKIQGFLITGAVLTALMLSSSTAFADEFPGSVPKAICGPGDHTESGLQGQTTTAERFSGDSERAYNCNLELVGMYRGDGAFSQDGPAYYGDCAYMATDHVTSLQQHLGMTVIDASDPTHPVPSAYLNDTAAALAPHETPKVNARRGLLAVGQTTGSNFSIYDVATDCRHPVLKATLTVPSGPGHHMGNFAEDGNTYYISQNFMGIGGFLLSVDLSDLSNPAELPAWQYEGDGRPHGLGTNPSGFTPGLAAGMRLYAGQPGTFGALPTSSGFGPDGLVIEDISDYQLRRSNPQIRTVSKLFWADQGTAEEMVPVKIKGHPYIITTDEAGGAGGPGGLAAACARGQSLFGYPQFIDMADETNPKIIAKVRLEVSDPANCLEVANNTPPDSPGTAPGTNLPATSGTTNYSEERCTVDNPHNAKMMACGFSNGGLRVFDIRDPTHAREIAYYKPGAVRTEVRPSSGSWAAGVDRTVEKISAWAHWVVVKGKGDENGNGNGKELQLWFVSDGNGFQIVRFSDHFKAQYKELFEDSDD